MIDVCFVKVKPSVSPIFFLVSPQLFLFLEEQSFVLSERKLCQKIFLWEVLVVILKSLEAIILLIKQIGRGNLGEMAAFFVLSVC